jgi:hypothetical protein
LSTLLFAQFPVQPQRSIGSARFGSKNNDAAAMLGARLVDLGRAVLMFRLPVYLAKPLN